jgi:hypothetical protein
MKKANLVITGKTFSFFQADQKLFNEFLEWIKARGGEANLFTSGRTGDKFMLVAVKEFEGVSSV